MILKGGFCMGNISKYLIYGLAYAVNRHPLECGMALLRRENKNEEELKAAKSFKKVLNATGISFSFALISIIFTTLNFMFAISNSGSSSSYVGISMVLLFANIIISPILIIVSTLMLRTSIAKDWIQYYNAHHNEYANFKNF